MQVCKHNNRIYLFWQFQGVCLAYDWLIIARVNPFVLLQQLRLSVKNHQSQVVIYLSSCFRYNNVTALLFIAYICFGLLVDKTAGSDFVEFIGNDFAIECFNSIGLLTNICLEIKCMKQ